MKSRNSPLTDTLEQASAGHIIEIPGPLQCHRLCSYCKKRLAANQERSQSSKALHSEPRSLGHRTAASSKCKHTEHLEGSSRNRRSRSDCHRMHTRTSPAQPHKQHSFNYLSTSNSSTILQSLFPLKQFFLYTLFLLLLTSHTSAQPAADKSHKHPAWSLLNIESVDSRQTTKTVQHHPESLQSGIPDIVATAGRLFRYHIPDSAFSGTVTRYQVYKRYISAVV